MLVRLDGPIPLTVLQDLVGVCRELYVEWTCSGADPLDLQELAEIGLELAHALTLARSSAPNSVGQRSAWHRAEAASERFGALLAKTEGMRCSVRARTMRVAGEPGASRLGSMEEREPSTRGPSP